MVEYYSIRIAAIEGLNKLEQHLTVHYLNKALFIKKNQTTQIGPKGIWKPKNMELPLSITNVFEEPYKDSFTKEGFKI